MKKSRSFIPIIFLLTSLFFIGIGVAQVQKIILGSVVIPPTKTLTVVFTGEGTGTVTISGSITCTSTSSYDFPAGTSLTLTATPSGSSIFAGWSGGGCSGTGTCAITLNENTTIYADFYIPPLGDYLIGWYRFNEGSGSVVYNHATGGSLGGGLLPNLNVVNDIGNFWTYLPGFGSNPNRNAPLNYASATFPSRYLGGAATGYHTQGFFHRLKTGTKSLYNTVFFDFWPGMNVFSLYFTSQTYPMGEFIKGGGYVSKTPAIPRDLGGEWIFYYVTNTGRLAQVRSNGTRVIGDGPTSFWDSSTYATKMVVGAQATSTDPICGCQGSFGDAIFYNFTTLTDAQWARWYDVLRGRYGMAPRSGW